jgi:hypothetical protein
MIYRFITRAAPPSPYCQPFDCTPWNTSALFQVDFCPLSSHRPLSEDIPESPLYAGNTNCSTFSVPLGFLGAIPFTRELSNNHKSGHILIETSPQEGKGGGWTNGGSKCFSFRTKTNSLLAVHPSSSC